MMLMMLCSKGGLCSIWDLNPVQAGSTQPLSYPASIQSMSCSLLAYSLMSMVTPLLNLYLYLLFVMIWLRGLRPMQNISRDSAPPKTLSAYHPHAQGAIEQFHKNICWDLSNGTRPFHSRYLLCMIPPLSCRFSTFLNQFLVTRWVACWKC